MVYAHGAAMRLVRHLASVLPAALAVSGVLLACDSLQQDAPAPYDASPLGNGLRLSAVQNPKSSDYHPCPSTSTNCASAHVSSVVESWLDTFDETMDGKSVGTLYIQDVGTPHPYGGIGVYEPNYIPASLTPVPGDVFDFAGPYQEAHNIGKAMFGNGTFLPQLYKPVGNYRYEFQPPPPMTIQVSDLYEDSSSGVGSDGNFPHARQFLQMLVTINDVEVGAGVDASKRVTYPMAGANGKSITNGPSISNELYDLKANDFPSGTHFKSVTGIVTWFFTFHIAPRTVDDLVVQ
jgi:hypothetical protein